MFQQASHNMDELDEIEQLRIAALQTLHQKKVDASKPTTVITQQSMIYSDTMRPSFEDDPIAPFPGYNNTRIQLSPRSAAFVESNMSILKRRKEGLDTDRWSRSPSPKYKRKSSSPLPPVRRATSPERKHAKRSSRSPIHIRRSDNYQNSHRSSYSSSHNNNSTTRHRHRSRDRVPMQSNGHKSSAGSNATMNPNRNRAEQRHRTRSKSPAKQHKPHSPKHTSRNRRNSELIAEELKTVAEKKRSDTKPEEREKIKECPALSENTNNNSNNEEEASDSSDSESSESDPSEAIDLFASEDSESENEGRFKCSSSRQTEKVAVPSKPRNKADLAATVLPGGDSKGNASGRYNDRSRRNLRNDRDRPRNSFKSSSIREIDTGSSDHHHRRGAGSRRDDRDRERDQKVRGLDSSSRKRTTSSEKL